MSSYNPYAPPQAQVDAARGQRDASYGHSYVPLGWRTLVASVSVVAMTAASAAMHLAQVTLHHGVAPVHRVPGDER
jgi:hypothetical protein